jgi:hypothetical protein
MAKSSGSSPARQEEVGQSPTQVISLFPAQQVNFAHFEPGVQTNNTYLEESTAEAQALLGLYNTTEYSQHNIPAFFEQIMVPAPDFLGMEFMQPPPDLTTCMPELDWLGQMDIFGSDFTPAIDQILEAQAVPEVNLLPENQEGRSTGISHDRTDSNSAKRRHAVFQQSPW